jgi:hypothetical protein
LRRPGGEKFPPKKTDSGLVERWLKKIRSRVPAGAMLSATVQMKSDRRYFASFRLLADGEVISSEARGNSPEEAVDEAGRGFCEHLPDTELPAA